MELKEVLIAHRYLPVEWLARASIVERDLTGGIETRRLQHFHDIGFARAVENGRRHRHALAKVLGKLDELAIVKRGNRLVVPVRLGDRRTKFLLRGSAHGRPQAPG